MRFKLKVCIKLILLVNFVILIAVILHTSHNYLFVKNFSNFLPINDENSIGEELHNPPNQVERIRKFHLENNDLEEAAFTTVKMVQKILQPTEYHYEQIENNQVSFKQTTRNIQHKIVHLDLKGAPPKLQYLKSILPMIQAAGGTGILIEYEDMFPYEGELNGIKAGNAYNKTELQEFIKETIKYDLEIIPLIQTFGHLEYVLKLESFRQIREVDMYPDSVCPSKNESWNIITKMVDQIINFHTKIVEIKWIHVGCDEVYHINQCSDCLRKNQSSRQIFVNHVKRIAEYIKSKHSSLTPLIWDDMLRGFLPAELKSSGLGPLVQPVVWIYGSSITALVPHRIWYLYMKTFSGVWIASAYKGASGSTKLIPSLKKHYENHMSWLSFASNYIMPGTVLKYNFQGIFLTGWSRYHHFSVLCETFPVSIPSLILNLILVNMFVGENSFSSTGRISINRRVNVETEVFQRWFNFMKCHNKRHFDYNHPHKKTYLMDVEKKIYICDFKESHLYEDIMKLVNLENIAIGFHISNSFRNNGFLYYNVNHSSVINFHNINAIEKAKQIDKDLNILSEYLKSHMQEFYDDAVINEFIEFKLNPIKNILDRVTNASKAAENIRIWKNRPNM